MDAIVTAGGIPQPDEPLYEYTKGGNKAMLDLAGKPMVQWILDALSEAEHVGNVVVVGLEPDDRLSCEKPLHFLPNQGGMLENIFAGAKKALEINPNAEVLLSVSSDIPSITGEMVDWLVVESSKTKHDVYYNVIPRAAMEKRFPESHRTWTKFKDIEICGGDMTVFRASLLTSEGGTWREIIASRKNVLKQASIIGFGTLILLFTRQLTLDAAVRRVSEKLDINARAIKCPYPELGMDVDKPFQLDLLHAYLANRTAV